MGSHYRFTTEFVGGHLSGKRSLGKPAVACKNGSICMPGCSLEYLMVPFLYWASKITIKSAQWTRQKMQNWRNCDGLAVPDPPFRPYNSTLLFLHPHCVVILKPFIWRIERGFHKKNQMWKNYCAVGMCWCGERGGVHRPSCARILRLTKPPLAVGRLTTCWKNSSSEAYTSPIEDDLNPN